MALTTPVSVEEYLRAVYEPECDYVDGSLEDRNVGEKDHSKLQLKLIVLLNAIPGVHVFPEVRVQVAPSRFRVPDVCLYLEEPAEQVFTTPPLLCIEILSPEDRISRFTRKVNDYLKMGVPNVWILDPQLKTGYWCDEKGIHVAGDRLWFSNPDIALDLKTLFY